MLVKGCWAGLKPGSQPKPLSSYESCACCYDAVVLLCLQQRAGSRSREGSSLRRGVLKGSVVAFITAGEAAAVPGCGCTTAGCSIGVPLIVSEQSGDH